RLIRIQERILDHVTGVFRVAHQAVNRVVKPVLVATYQLTKRGRLASQAVGDELAVLRAHGGLLFLGRRRKTMGPKTYGPPAVARAQEVSIMMPHPATSVKRKCGVRKCRVSHVLRRGAKCYFQVTTTPRYSSFRLSSPSYALPSSVGAISWVTRPFMLNRPLAMATSSQCWALSMSQAPTRRVCEG